MATSASTRSSTESARACAPLLVLVLALAACGDDGGYAVRVAHDGPEALSCVEVSLVGSCAEQSGGGAEPVGARRTAGGPTDGPLSGLGRVPAGPAALYVRACDGCRIVAAGCRDVVLEDGGGGEIEVALVSVDGPACSGTCAAGRCGDASIDAGADASTVDGCTFEGEPCTSGMATGTCIAVDGTLGCCTGCRDGERCIEPASQSASACGHAGAECVSCDRPPMDCQQAVCFDGTCVVDYPPGTCGGEGDGTCTGMTDFVDCAFCGDGVPCSPDPAAEPRGTCRGAPRERTCCTTCWDGSRCLELDELPGGCAGGVDCDMCG